MGRLIIKIISLLVISGIIIVGGVLGWINNEFTRSGPLKQHAVVLISPGASLRSISNMLAENKIIHSALAFEWGTRLLSNDTGIQAGEYFVPQEVSADGIVEILQSGKTVQRRVTIAEGLSSSQIISQINDLDGLVGDLIAVPKEGSLLPETYFFSYGDSRQSIVDRMENSMSDTVSRLWVTRDKDLPLNSPEEAIILASIVEKETGIATERAYVASVFINRLLKGMRLQSDPTVIYGIVKGKHSLNRSLTKADLQNVTPYNTYIINRLPPGPIANPGLGSLEAVLHPADSNNLYFVADGTGGHVFSNTLEEHNKNVRKWRKLNAQKNDHQ